MQTVRPFPLPPMPYMPTVQPYGSARYTTARGFIAQGSRVKADTSLAFDPHACTLKRLPDTVSCNRFKQPFACARTHRLATMQISCMKLPRNTLQRDRASPDLHFPAETAILPAVAGGKGTGNPTRSVSVRRAANPRFPALLGLLYLLTLHLVSHLAMELESQVRDAIAISVMEKRESEGECRSVVLEVGDDVEKCVTRHVVGIGAYGLRGMVKESAR